MGKTIHKQQQRYLNLLILLVIMLDLGSAWTPTGMLPRLRARVAAGSVGAALGLGLLTGAPPLMSVGLGLGPAPAVAAVGEGGLPDGVLAFNKLLKYQKDWAAIDSAVTKRGSEMEEREILEIKILLKKLANEYGDMELLSRGIVGSESDRDAAKELAKSFRVQMRDIDNALTDKNLAKLTEAYPKSAATLQNFLDMLQDVPDEL